MKRRLLAISLLITVSCIAAVAVFHTPILFALGDILVHAEAPQRADAALVLGGDYRGDRILKAAELLRQGYIRRIFVSGSGPIYGFHESEIAIAFAVKRGFPREPFVSISYQAVSTDDEVRGAERTLRSLGIHKLLLVTSPSHTGRATRIARGILAGIEIHPIAAEDQNWAGGFWWKSREGRKTWFQEILKNAAYVLGI